MENSKRVLKISDAWHWFAEAEQLLLNVRGLLTRGWEIHIGCQPDSPLWPRAEEIGAILHPLPGLRGANPMARPANVMRIARLLDEIRPRILHAYRSPPHALAATARPFAAFKAPLVRSRGAAQRVRRHPLNRMLYRGADALIATSSKIADDLFDLGVASERIHVVRGGIDVGRVRGGDGAAFLARHGIPPSTPVLGMLARIDDVKGHRFVVDAVATLKRRGIRCSLLCAGEPWGDAAERLADRIARAGVGEQVHLLGRVDDVAGFLAAIDIAVVASTGSETIARAVLEEMAAGCALVATSVGVIPELVEQHTGVIVPPFDAASLADAIEELLHDPERRAQLGEAARKKVERSYTVERLGEQISQVYADARSAFRGSGDS